MRAILVTGFEPFDGGSLNPSALAAESLAGSVLSGRLVESAVLPCVFGEAIAALEAELERADPELVICLGQAGGRPAISLERVALNVDDARIPDNAGAQPIDQPICPGGPAAFWSTLPIKAIVAALREEGIPAAVSQTAGTFVCNHVFYGLMRALDRRGAEQGVRGGFVHVPFTPAQAAARAASQGEKVPSLPLAQIVRAVEVAVEVSLQTERDAQIPGGATH